MRSGSDPCACQHQRGVCTYMYINKHKSDINSTRQRNVRGTEMGRCCMYIQEQIAMRLATPFPRALDACFNSNDVSDCSLFPDLWRDSKKNRTHAESSLFILNMVTLSLPNTARSASSHMISRLSLGFCKS